MRYTIYQSRSISRTLTFLLMGLGLAAAMSCGGGGGSNPSDSTAVAAADSSSMGPAFDVKPTDAPLSMSDSLKLPAGFNATTLVEGYSGSRHIAVAPNGAVFVKLATLHNGKGIYRLMDTNGDGEADKTFGFGNYTGTGIAIRDGYLYASTDTCVYHYKLDKHFNVVDPNHPQKIVTGLLSRGEHEAKAIALDNSGNLYVNIGAYSNACQLVDRTKGSPGQQPCPILDSAGGIWQFKADVPNQTYGDDHRYATGLRNVVGLDWNQQTNSLFVMQHGRDQLATLFPQYWDSATSAELPAECMYELHKGSNCGWPYIFYDEFQRKKVLAPNMAVTGRRQVARMPRIRWRLSQGIWHQTGYYSIPAASSRPDIRMAHLSLFMDPGTGRRCRKRDSTWFLFPLRMASRRANGRSLQTISPAVPKIPRKEMPSTGLVAWLKVRTVRSMSRMILSGGISGRSRIKVKFPRKG